MIIHISPTFKKSLKKIHKSIQADFFEKLHILQKEPFHPTLKTHKLTGNLHTCHAFKLHNGFRVLFHFSGDHTIDLLDIGNHDKYSFWEKVFQ